ncbi:hypothetical protein C8R46DRAFT_1346755 [Mycena filopes]|nr:hypothetical protein C8R46DRAFT_1346755 [Mycena filopes]
MASFTLALLLKYDPDKLAAYAELDSPTDTLKRLRHHLTELKIPHPKPENVRFVAGEGVHFSWVTKEDSALYNQVARGVLAVHGQGSTSPVMRRYFIESLEMERQPAPLYATNRSTSRPENSGVVVSSAPPLLLPTASRRDSLSSLTPEQEKMQDEAQQFLDGLRLGPAATMMDVDSKQPIPRPVVGSGLLGVGDQAHLHRASSIASSTRSSRNEYPMHHPKVETIMEDETMDDVPYYLTGPDSRSSTPQSDEMVMSPSPVPGLPTLPTREIKIFEDEEEDARTPPFDVQPPAKENDGPVVAQLSLELQQISKEVSGHLLKEQAILHALNNLNAEIPEPLPPSADDDFIARVRLQMLQDEFDAVLAKRQAVEESVREIARERRAPFVFPALMDAFVGISRLSSYALGSDD